MLDALPEMERRSLLRQLQFVELPTRTMLFSPESVPRYVHFLLTGVASVVTTMVGGEDIEVGLVGQEGFAEKIQVLGPHRGSTQCFMQVAGTGLRMDFQRFREMFLQSPALLETVHEYVQHDALVLAQISACNRLHEVEPRLARWLLMVHDRIEKPELRITQEFLGEMLGARRSSVSLAAGNLQQRGMIEYSRGRILIKDREALEATACECYAVISGLFHALYQSSAAQPALS